MDHPIDWQGVVNAGAALLGFWLWPYLIALTWIVWLVSRATFVHWMECLGWQGGPELIRGLRDAWRGEPARPAVQATTTPLPRPDSRAVLRARTTAGSAGLAVLLLALLATATGCTVASVHDARTGLDGQLWSFWSSADIRFTRTPVDPLCPDGAQATNVAFGSDVNVEALRASNELLATTAATLAKTAAGAAGLPVPGMRGGPPAAPPRHPCP